MRSKFVGYVIALTVGFGLATPALAQSKKHKGGDVATEKSIEKQMEWERKVMGDDSTKQSDMKKIAAAQKLADHAAKNPPPLPPPKVKDPSKEGVRAKQEAAIGLPIASDEAAKLKKSSSGRAKKFAEPAPAANDELGALVASSLAEGKAPGATASGPEKVDRAKTGAKSHGRSRSTGAAEPSGIDSLFATSK